MTPDFGRDEVRATAGGTACGGILFGLYDVGFGGIVATIQPVVGTDVGAWLSWAVLVAVLGIGFSGIGRRTMDAYVRSTMALAARYDGIRWILRPLIRRAALTTTASGMGLAYGIGIAAFYIVVTGVWSTPNPVGAVGFVLFGWGLGLGYGAILQR